MTPRRRAACCTVSGETWGFTEHLVNSGSRLHYSKFERERERIGVLSTRASRATENVRICARRIETRRHARQRIGFDRIRGNRVECGILLRRCFLSGIDTPSLAAQGEQRRPSFFNIDRDIPWLWRIVLIAIAGGAAFAAWWFLQPRGLPDGFAASNGQSRRSRSISRPRPRAGSVRSWSTKATSSARHCQVEQHRLRVWLMNSYPYHISWSSSAESVQPYHVARRSFSMAR